MIIFRITDAAVRVNARRLICFAHPIARKQLRYSLTDLAERQEKTREMDEAEIPRVYVNRWKDYDDFREASAEVTAFPLGARVVRSSASADGRSSPVA